MSDNLKITCPSCGDTFPATDALDDYAKSKQKEFQAETEKQLKHKFENENKEKPFSPKNSKNESLIIFILSCNNLFGC